MERPQSSVIPKSGNERKSHATPYEDSKAAIESTRADAEAKDAPDKWAGKIERPGKEAMLRRLRPSRASQSRNPRGSETKAAAARALPSARSGDTGAGAKSGRRTCCSSSGSDMDCGPARVSGRNNGAARALIDGLETVGTAERNEDAMRAGAAAPGRSGSRSGAGATAETGAAEGGATPKPGGKEGHAGETTVGGGNAGRVDRGGAAPGAGAV